jgi:hypothetical protein
MRMTTRTASADRATAVFGLRWIHSMVRSTTEPAGG